MKRVFCLLIIAFVFQLNLFSKDISPNPWSLIIYRPENTAALNDVRCWIKITDFDTGEDVTYSKTKAKYEWVANTRNFYYKNPQSLARIFMPDRNTFLYNYKKTYFLNGGMAMHLNLQKGKYIISVYTPKEKADFFECENKKDWISNDFYYSTENPTNVIFVSPTANDNGFYNGGWYISYTAPQFYKITKPKMSE